MIVFSGVNVRPIFTGDYPANARLAYAIFFRYFSLAFSLIAKFVNFKNITLLKDGRSTPFPSWAGMISMYAPVFYVVFVGVPLKVFKVIVEFYSVFVGTLQTFWSRADKGGENKPVNSLAVVLGSVIKRNNLVSILIGAKATDDRLFPADTPVETRLNPPFARYFIGREFYNFLPFFFGHRFTSNTRKLIERADRIIGHFGLQSLAHSKYTIFQGGVL